MADWRQVQARIRKAKASGDPSGQLSALFENTRDPMVAFELARLQENSGNHAEAARWYTAAAERFRRAQWKAKAQEALARLGSLGVVGGNGSSGASQVAPVSDEGHEEHPRPIEPPQPSPETQSAAPATSSSPGAAESHKRRRRGRRGGRRHRRRREGHQPAVAAGQASSVFDRPVVQAPASQLAVPAPTIDSLAEAGREVRGRAVEPALASRLAQLESQLRRLLVSPAHPLSEADQAPAGPGVFVLSDTEQTTYYDIEACETLRVAVGNVARGLRGSRGGGSLKGPLADHLGIGESQVGKYIKQHCAVRWIQMDEGAKLLAHFAIAVLRPVLDE